MIGWVENFKDTLNFKIHILKIILGGAMDSILQQLAYYKRHDPASMEEQELMENLFDVLCALLLYTPNRDLFLRAEGLQLMNLMLREKKTSRYYRVRHWNCTTGCPNSKWTY